MSLAARSQDFGTKYYSKDFVETTTVTFKSGSIRKSQTGFTARDHSCDRYNKTKNVPSLIAGTSSTFRSPSTYSRQVFNATYYSGAWKTTTHWNTSIASVLIEGEPDPLAANTQWKVLPIWGGGHQVSVDVSLRNEANVKALRKLASGKMELGASLGESKTTLNMLATSATTLLESYRALKRRDLRAVAQLLGRPRDGFNTKDAANWYLAYKYGWSPLMNDLYTGYNLLREGLESAQLVMGSAAIPDNATVEGGHNSAWFTTGSAQRVHRCRLWAQVDVAELRQANQLGLVNPMAITWELLPLSFVLDWALPIGNVLEAATAPMGLSFVGGYTSVYGEGSCTARLKPYNGYDEITPRQTEASFFSLQRKKLSNWPQVGFYAKADPLNTNNVASAAALFRQILMTR